MEHANDLFFRRERSGRVEPTRLGEWNTDIVLEPDGDYCYDDMVSAHPLIDLFCNPAVNSFPEFAYRAPEIRKSDCSVEVSSAPRWSGNRIRGVWEASEVNRGNATP